MRPVTRRHIALPVSLSVTAALLYTFRPQILAAFASSPSASTRSIAVPASPAATPSRSIATAAPPHRGRGASEAQAVERRLASMGLRLRRRVQPDGNCQFRALADQVRAALSQSARLWQVFSFGSANVQPNFHRLSRDLPSVFMILTLEETRRVCKDTVTIAMRSLSLHASPLAYPY